MSDYTARAEELLPALIHQESGGDPNAVSPKGAFGLGQTMPATARDPGFGVQPMRDNSPREQRRIARDYLAAMLQRYRGDDALALAAYNAGPGNVDKYGGVPPFRETRDYVGRILGAVGIGSAHASERPEGGPGEGLQPAHPSQPAEIDFDEFMGQSSPSAPVDAAQELDFDAFMGNAPETSQSESPGDAPKADGIPVHPLSLPPTAVHNPEARSGTALDAAMESPSTRALYRQGARAIAAPLSFANTLVNLPANTAVAAANRFAGTDIPYADNQVDKAVDSFLTREGIDPAPESSAEKVVGAGMQAGIGAGGYRAIGGLLPEAAPVAKAVSGMGKGAGTQAVASVAGSATQEGLERAGVGPVASIGAGILAGIAAGSLGPKMMTIATGGAGRATKRALEVLVSSEGDKATAARTLRAMLGDDEADRAIARIEEMKSAGNVELVPGSKPTLAEVAPSDKTSIVQRAVLERSGGWPQAENNQARLDYLRGTFGDESTLADADKDIRHIANKFHTTLKSSGIDPDSLATTPTNFLTSLEKIKSDPRLYGATNPQVQKMVDNIEAMFLAGSGKATPSKPAAPGLAAQINRDVDTERDDVITAIRKLGGLDKEEWGDLDITRAFKPDPRHGPVFGAVGSPRVRGLDDMTARLVEHGYLPYDAKPRDLEELLTEISKGTADESALWSNAKSGYANLDRGAQSAEDIHREKLDSLIDLMLNKERRANAPKPTVTPESQAFWTDLDTLRQNIDSRVDWGALGLDPASISDNNKRRMTAAATTLARALRKDLRSALPESDQYFKDVSNAIKRKQAIEAGQDILDRGQNARVLIPVKDGQVTGENVLSNAAFGRASAKKKNLLALKRSMSPEQRDAVERVQRDLDRYNMAVTGGKVEGSNTFQKLATDQRLKNIVAEDILGGALGDKDIGKGRATLASMLGSKVGGAGLGALLGGGLGGTVGSAIGAGLGVALNSKEERIVELIRQGMLDPDVGVEMLRTAKLYGGPPKADVERATLASILEAQREFGSKLGRKGKGKSKD